MAGALRGSLQRCTFCQGPEPHQGDQDQRQELSGRWPPAAPVTNGQTSSGARCGRTQEGIRAGAGLAADSGHPLPDLGTLLWQCEGTRGTAGHLSCHPQILEDGMMLPVYSAMVVLPPAVD